MGKTGLMLIQLFAAYQAQRGFSTHTVRRRTGTLTAFRTFIAPSEFETATDTDITEFLARWPKPRTRHAYRSDLAAFYKWALRRQLVHADPTLLVDPVKVPRSLPRPVPAPAVIRLIATADDDETKLMLALAAFAGLRINEIANLEADDVDLAHRLLVVRNGKGGKDRTVPVHPMLARLLQPHLDHGRVFPYTAATVGRRMSTYMRAVGVEATGHKLRASFGTELAAASHGNVVLVQRLLGHGSPLTTMGYIGWAGGEAADTVDAMYRTG